MIEKMLQAFIKNRFEVLEYWGLISKQLADELDFDYDDELDVISVNVWICGGKVLRVVENPFSPKRIPYMVCPYELNPLSILWCRYTREHARFTTSYEWSCKNGN
jgi:hypothetical protein